MVNDLSLLFDIKVCQQTACEKRESVVSVCDWVIGCSGRWLIADVSITRKCSETEKNIRRLTEIIGLHDTV